MTVSACPVTFRGLPHSPALEQLVQERADWLRQFGPPALAVRALIDVPHRHQHEHAIRVQLRIAIPDNEPITVDREGLDDAYVVVRDTFDIARRCLQDAVRAQRGFVKTHSPVSGRVI